MDQHHTAAAQQDRLEAVTLLLAMGGVAGDSRREGNPSGAGMIQAGDGAIPGVGGTILGGVACDSRRRRLRLFGKTGGGQEP